MQNTAVQSSDRQSPGGGDEVLNARRWQRILSEYSTPNRLRSIAELAITVLPLVVLWTAAWFTFHLGHAWASLLIAIPAAGFLVRLFMIQHDCGHGTFFAGRLANDWVGRVLGVLTLTPYDCWRHTHAIHHATTGNLDRRGIGDLDTLTVREYRALSVWGRLKYRLYRHPLVMFGVGPAYLFLLQQRCRRPPSCATAGSPGPARWQPISRSPSSSPCSPGSSASRRSCSCICRSRCWPAPPAYGCSMFSISSSTRSWDRNESWNLQQAALHGSSHYDLPALLRWFTANIGVHHVHHLSSRIPYYRLPRVLRDHPELRDVGRITLLQSFRCVRLVLWDEAQRRLVSFREI